MIVTLYTTCIFDQLKATQAKANLSSETTGSQEQVSGPAKAVKRKERTARPKSGGQSLADAMLPVNEVEPDVLMDDPLVSLNDLQAGLSEFNGNNKHDNHDIHPVEQPPATSPGCCETRWTDPVPPPSMTMPSWLHDQQMYPPPTTRPSTSSSGYTPQTRSTLSSPVAYIGSLPAQSSGRSGSSRPNTANAREQHIEVINHPTCECRPRGREYPAIPLCAKDTRSRTLPGLSYVAVLNL
jgi:hypothetical protein